MKLFTTSFTLFIIGLGLHTHGFAQSGIQSKASRSYITPGQSPVFDPIAPQGTFYIAPTLQSMLSVNTPFTAISGLEPQAFRSALPNAYGLELGYALSSTLELAFFGGWEAYDTRNNVGTEDNLDFQNVRLRHYPFILKARYSFARNSYMRANIEAGLGYGFGKLELTRDSDPDDQNLELSMNGLRMHAAIGAGLPWTDHISLHGHIGYAYTALGSMTHFVDFDPIEQRSPHGVYLSGQFRISF